MKRIPPQVPRLSSQPKPHTRAVSCRRHGRRALGRYGANRLDVAIPTLKSLLVDEALSPVSVLKLLDLALAAADR